MTVLIGESEFQMFLDTGAEISYLQDEIIERFPKSDSMTDCFPGFGTFDIETYLVGMGLGCLQFSLRCGTLLLMLGMTLTMGGTEGVLGNDIFRDKKSRLFSKKEIVGHLDLAV